MKLEKGQPGYIKARKLRYLMLAVAEFAIVAAVFILGYMQTGSRMNLFTVAAAVGCLPAAKMLVEFITMAPYKSIDPEKYKELDPEKYGAEIAKHLQKGKTPAGMHIPICVEEILAFLDIQPGQVGLDATLGYGGHSQRISKSSKAAAYSRALWAFRAASSTGLPCPTGAAWRARNSMARMHWEEPSVP